jgi:ribosomal protein S27E
MNIIKSFLNLFKKGDGIWVDGVQRVTEEELKVPLVKSFYKDHECPDCHIKPMVFLEGPHGGASVNIECSSCGSRFNICPEIGYIERI